MRRLVLVSAFAVVIGLTMIASKPFLVSSQVSAPKFHRTPRPIPNEYIVVFNDQVPGNSITGLVAELTNRHGGIVLNTYRYALKGYAVRVQESAAIALSNDPRVAFVEENGQAIVNDPPNNTPSSHFQNKANSLGILTTIGPPVPWDLDRIDQVDHVNSVNYGQQNPPSLPLNYSDGQYTYNADGTGIHVYVLDTGIIPTHQEFGGRASVLYDAVDDDGNPNNDPNTDRNGLDGIDNPLDQLGNPCTQAGHGTAIASIIGGANYGVAKNVTIHAVRVVRCNKTWNVNEAIAGIERISYDAGTRPGTKIANMSIGYDDSFNTDPGWTLDWHAADQTALDTAVRGSMTYGIVYVCAAGNGDDSPSHIAQDVDAYHVSPARVKDVLTVSGATFTSTFRDIKITSGNFGPKVDLFASGANVPCASNASNTAQTYKDGTSVSAPIVSGIAALYAQRFPSNFNFPNGWEQTINLLIKSNVTLGAINLTNGAPTTTTYNRLAYMGAIPGARVNPIDDTGYFVWRQYLDFYGCSQVPWQPSTDLYDTVYVEPNDSDLQSKRDQISSCGSDTTCVGTQRVALAHGFFESSQFWNNHPALNPSYKNTSSYDDEFVTQCYKVFLQRDPDPSGYSFWRTSLSNDQSASRYDNLISCFITSSEYRSRFDGYSTPPCGA